MWNLIELAANIDINNFCLKQVSGRAQTPIHFLKAEPEKLCQRLALPPSLPWPSWMQERPFSTLLFMCSLPIVHSLKSRDQIPQNLKFLLAPSLPPRLPLDLELNFCTHSLLRPWKPLDFTKSFQTTKASPNPFSSHLPSNIGSPASSARPSGDLNSANRRDLGSGRGGEMLA